MTGADAVDCCGMLWGYYVKERSAQKKHTKNRTISPVKTLFEGQRSVFCVLKS